MKSRILKIDYPNKDIQKVQIITFDDWNKLHFLSPVFNERAFEQFVYIYRNNMVDAFPFIFGNVVLFYLPDDFSFDYDIDEEKYGKITDELTRATILLKEGVRFINKQPHFLNNTSKELYEYLEERGCLKTAFGKLNTTKIVPVGKKAGFLTETHKDAALKVNSSFFIMDFIDTATVFDQVGEPFGLMVKDGKIISPPLYDREALIVRNDKVEIRKLSLSALRIFINDEEIQGTTYCRPQFRITPKGNKDVVIIGSKVVCVKNNGNTEIPASGFVIKVNEDVNVNPGDEVIYSGMEEVSFGLQVGNSLIIDGKKTERFISRFYDFKKPGISYPPSLYPLNFRKSRAPRIALGADKDKRPMIIWAEGAGKYGHEKGKESNGVSLKEMSEICQMADMHNGINLDGGGSAQILLKNSRKLKISDRDRYSFIEKERAVPIGLVIY